MSITSPMSISSSPMHADDYIDLTNSGIHLDFKLLFDNIICLFLCVSELQI